MWWKHWYGSIFLWTIFSTLEITSMSLFGGSFGILQNLQEFITLPNFQKIDQNQWNFMNFLKKLPLAFMIIFSLFDLTTLYWAEFAQYPDYSFVQFIVINSDSISANLGILTLFVIGVLTNQKRFKLVKIVENFEDIYPYKFTFPSPAWANFKLSAVVALEVFTNAVFFVYDSESYQFLIIVSYWIYIFFIIIVDATLLYIVVFIHGLTSYIVAFRCNLSRYDKGYTDMFNQMIELIRIFKCFNDTFGIMIATIFIHHFICACVDSYFIFWQVFNVPLNENDIFFVITCFIWVTRNFIIIYHITSTCDMFFSQVRKTTEKEHTEDKTSVIPFRWKISWDVSWILFWTVRITQKSLNCIQLL